MIPLVAISLLAGSWAGLRLATWIGVHTWVRVVSLLVWISALAMLAIALLAHAGNCAGEEYGVIEDVIPEPRVFPQLGMAWASAFLVAICSGFSARILLARDWPAFAVGVLIASVVCAAFIVVFDPSLFESCVPTPLT